MAFPHQQIANERFAEKLPERRTFSGAHVTAKNILGLGQAVAVDVGDDVHVKGALHDFGDTALFC